MGGVLGVIPADDEREIASRLGQDLRNARVRQGLSVNDMARRAGVPKAVYNRFEAGLEIPTTQRWKRIRGSLKHFVPAVRTEMLLAKYELPLETALELAREDVEVGGGVPARPDRAFESGRDTEEKSMIVKATQVDVISELHGEAHLVVREPLPIRDGDLEAIWDFVGLDRSGSEIRGIWKVCGWRKS